MVSPLKMSTEIFWSSNLSSGKLLYFAVWPHLPNQDLSPLNTSDVNLVQVTNVTSSYVRDTAVEIISPYS